VDNPIEIIPIKLLDYFVRGGLVNVVVFPMRHHMTLVEHLERWKGTEFGRKVLLHEARVGRYVQSRHVHELAPVKLGLSNERPTG